MTLYLLEGKSFLTQIVKDDHMLNTVDLQLLHPEFLHFLPLALTYFYKCTTVKLCQSQVHEYL